MSRQSTLRTSRASSCDSLQTDNLEDDDGGSVPSPHQAPSCEPSNPYPAPFSDGTPSVEVLAGLGFGGYANVVLVMPSGQLGLGSSDDQLMAMKVVSKMKQMRPKDKKRLATELKVMRDVPPSRFLERCHAAFESATDIFFVCDYLAGGDLFFHTAQRMKRGVGAFNESECRVLLAEVTLGLEHLHNNGFIHRDLKVENVMLDASGHVKLIDFGLAVEIIQGAEQQPMTPSGSLSSMPPELLAKGQNMGGRHTDWWALGILAFELMTGLSPWSSLTDRQRMVHEIQYKDVKVPECVSQEARDFLQKLLHRNVRKRLGTAMDADVKTSRFFSDIDWPAMERGETEPAFVLRHCGPAVVDKREWSQALAEYAGKPLAPPTAPGCFLEEEAQHGVKSPWFLGVDVVTCHPDLWGQRVWGQRGGFASSCDPSVQLKEETSL